MDPLPGGGDHYHEPGRTGPLLLQDLTGTEDLMRYYNNTPHMDRIIKCKVSEEEADKLTEEAHKKEITRTELLREIVITYLQRSQAGPGDMTPEARAQTLTLMKSLEETQRDREDLQLRVKSLEEALSEKIKDLEWTRGQYAALTTAHQEALRKIPVPPSLLEDGRPRPSWWDRITGRTSPPQE